jgi:hypothetical protein
MIHLSRRFTSASEPRSIEVFLTVVSATSASPSLSAKRLPRFSTQFEPLYATNFFYRKQETFLYEYPLHWVLLPTEKRTKECCFSVIRSSGMVAILTTEISL